MIATDSSAARHIASVEDRADRELATLERSVERGAGLSSPTQSPRRVVVVEAAELLGATFPARDMLLSPWLESQSLTMVYAWRGIGKTHVALGIAYALASGGEFLGWKAPQPAPVLYIDGEMPGAALRERVARIVARTATEPPRGFLRFVTPDLQPDGVMPNLATQEGQQAINAALGDARVIVVDNLSCLVRGVKENEGDGWAPVSDWALRMRATGKSVIFIHHAGKGGAQRGTSKREDLLDVVMLLRRPADYQPDQGARFEVHFEKARSLHGQDVTAVEAKLETDDGGKQVWAMRSVEDASDRQMIELAELGMQQSDIAKELNVNRSTVMRRLRKAQEEGRYRPKAKAARASGRSHSGVTDD